MRKLLSSLIMLTFLGCTSTKVTVVTVVTKTAQEYGSSEYDADYYQGVMSKKEVKKLLNDTLDGATPEKPERD